LRDRLTFGLTLSATWIGGGGGGDGDDTGGA
jgi:hypothetical protein